MATNKVAPLNGKGSPETSNHEQRPDSAGFVYRLVRSSGTGSPVTSITSNENQNEKRPISASFIYRIPTADGTRSPETGIVVNGNQSQQRRSSTRVVAIGDTRTPEKLGALNGNLSQKRPISSRSIFRYPRTTQEKVLSCLAVLFLIVILVFVTALSIVSDSRKALLRDERFLDFYNDEICSTQTCKATAELIKQNVEPSVDPCVDFYEYACGGWMKKNPLPEGQSIVGSFYSITGDIHNTIIGLLENGTFDADEPNATINAKKLYRGCINEETREGEGVQPLIGLIQEMGGWSLLGTKTWKRQDYVWYHHLAEVNRKFFFGAIIYVRVMAHLPGFIVVSKPAFIFNQVADIDSEDEGARINATESCVQYVVNCARLLGSTLDDDELYESATRVVQFENDLRKLGNDSVRVIRQLKIDALTNSTEGLMFSWEEYFNLMLRSETPVNNETGLIAIDDDYLTKVPQFIEDSDQRVVADYIGLGIMYSLSKYSAPALRDLRYNLTEEEYDGRSFCFIETCFWMDSACTRLFLAHNFSAAIKKDVTEMVDMMRLAYKSTIEQNTWMDKETKEAALEKLMKIRTGIGYEDWLMDNDLFDQSWEPLDNFREEKFFENMIQLRTFTSNESFSEWGKNNTEITISNPLMVNAFYFPLKNYIEVTAGIIQSPFYKFSRIDACNYGALGFVIGHEMSHAFDTSGGQYDSDGKRRNWWTNATKERYQEKVQCFIDQYSEIVEPVSNMSINGSLTIGENIADNAAISNAYKAFRLSLALSDESVNRRKRLVGVSHSPEQLFFLGYASVWCQNISREAATSRMQYDPHSPAKFRVNVPVSNFIEFARAFKCAPGTPMNRINKCVLW